MYKRQVLELKKDLKFEKKDPTGKDLYLSAFIVWIYNEEPQKATIEFEFLKDAVSYTHLDVYKRQELSMLVGIAELELLFGQFKVQIQHIVGSGDAVGYLHGKDGPVSYTHLDVYKRQVHLPNTANFKNIVIATKQRGITSIKRLYEKVLGNKSFHTVRTQYR